MALADQAEQRLRLDLDEARATLARPGGKGDAVEGAFRGFLARHLPRRYDIGKGEVIDQHGRRSREIDVLVLNDEHPRWQPHVADGVYDEGLYLVEGVSAAAEVKTTLTAGALDDAIEKAISFKALEPCLEGAMWSESLPSDGRWTRSVPFFVFAFEAGASADTLVRKLQDAGSWKPDAPSAAPDAVFVLGQGWCIDFGDGQCRPRVVNADGQPARGWCSGSPKGVIFDLLRWLTITMPRFSRQRSFLDYYFTRLPTPR